MNGSISFRPLPSLVSWGPLRWRLPPSSQVFGGGAGCPRACAAFSVSFRGPRRPSLAKMLNTAPLPPAASNPVMIRPMKVLDEPAASLVLPSVTSAAAKESITCLKMSIS